MGRASPNTRVALVRLSSWPCGCMVDLATVTYALVSMVTRYGLSPTQPCVVRLRYVLSAMAANACWRLNIYDDVPPFCRHPLVSRPSAIPPVRLSIISLSPFGLSLFPLCLSEVFLLFSGASRRFLPPSLRNSYPEIGLVPHRSSTLVVGSLLVWWAVTASLECPCARLPEPGRYLSRYIRCLQVMSLTDGLA
jgi:hypothetical protein